MLNALDSETRSFPACIVMCVWERVANHGPERTIAIRLQSGKEGAGRIGQTTGGRETERDQKRRNMPNLLVKRGH